MATKEYLAKLESVSGIGAKTALKIAEEFPTEADLVEALQSDFDSKSELLISQHLDGLTTIFLAVEESVQTDEEEAPVLEDVSTQEVTPEPVQTDEEPTLDFTHPDFDWQNKSLWWDDPEARDYWLLTKT